MMGQIAMLLDEALVELGFETESEAIEAGYTADYGINAKGELYARYIKK